MQFRTELMPDHPGYRIEHHEAMVHLGSCFSEHIGNKFIESGFQAIVNPMGQQYNLFSIAAAIHRIIQNRSYEFSELGKHQEIYYSFDHHSDFSSADADAMLKNLNEKLKLSHQLLQKANYIFITPGTSHYYIYKDSGKIVSNCHKIPADQFEMRMAGPAENETILSQMILALKAFNPGAKIILTLSPVRYAALGFPMNSYSKSSLIVALHQIVQKFDHIFYFPSYEMMMDDLRDYRFYQSDLLHPNEQGVAYIWEKFTAAFCSDECIKIMDAFMQLHQSSLHRPRQIYTEAHQTFLKKNLEKASQLQKRFPYAPLAEVVNRFENQLKQTS